MTNIKEWIGTALIFILVCIYARTMRRFEEKEQADYDETVSSHESQGRFWSFWNGPGGIGY